MSWFTLLEAATKDRVCYGFDYRAHYYYETPDGECEWFLAADDAAAIAYVPANAVYLSLETSEIDSEGIPYSRVLFSLENIKAN